ncbi:PDR/VanB family oxidoreductase [Novosphingobium sp.]|uniref:PDR/VanB family oxidoreductase n=1 Tax=Novosphingobium sp. TaxID=1874826 RepID=UPI002B495B3A|nr:PDR/VanB family oxidoreductase [Novosphingobium sp.]HKR92354.1 PDR/VanB family oxidoreductase [Novosphingobium sp.]
MTEPLFPARIVAIELAAEDILSFTLHPLDAALPDGIDPGSHIDVHLPNGMMRSYSLSNGYDQRLGFRLTVARDANSRGGSTYMHDKLRVGQIIDISKPRNNFKLAEDAAMSVFFAGGIGVTPFLPMIARLNQVGKPWRLYYCTRNEERAALVNEIRQLEADGVGQFISHYDDRDGLFDLKGTLAALSGDTHVYCCGPKGMLDAFRAGAQVSGLGSDRVHFEYFNADVESATEGGFVVVLNQSGAEIRINPGQTILQALTEHGVNVPFSCEEGICGACETRVIEGVPDHRDMILSDEEKRQSKTMMVCCSGSKSDRLVLDL